MQSLFSKTVPDSMTFRGDWRRGEQAPQWNGQLHRIQPPRLGYGAKWARQSPHGPGAQGCKTAPASTKWGGGEGLGLGCQLHRKQPQKTALTVSCCTALAHMSSLCPTRASISATFSTIEMMQQVGFSSLKERES